LLEDFGGGPIPGRKFVAVFPGGYSTPIVPIDVDPTLDFEGLKQAGSALGTGGMIVIDDSADTKKIALEVARFFATESCGACPPCTYGTSETYKLFQEFQNSSVLHENTVLKIREFCEMMKFRGQCAHNRAAAMTHLSFLNHFPEIFR
jgi:NADH-quinone oxidoreductase subunit F